MLDIIEIYKKAERYLDFELGIRQANLTSQINQHSPLAICTFSSDQRTNSQMAKKKTLVNAESSRSVEEFIAGVQNSKRKADSEVVLALMKELTAKEPKMWGKSIVGFGRYSYQRKNGDEFEWFNVGFSPAKAHLSLYFMYDLTNEPLLEKLGKHSKGKGCLYVKNLADVDMSVLKEMILKSDKWER